MSDSFDPMDTSVHGGFSKQEYWSGLPCPSPGDFPDPGIKPWSPELQAESLPSEVPGKPENALLRHQMQDLSVGRTAYCLSKFEVTTARKQFIWAFQTSL